MNKSLPREHSECCGYEQRSLALFQTQPEGPVPIVHPSALSLAHVEQLHRTRAALMDKK